jgi:WD40 repeat protein
LCPITKEVLKDPVLAVDGHVYERDAIEQWFRWNRTSPMTGCFLHATGLMPEEPLRRAVEEFMEWHSRAGGKASVEPLPAGSTGASARQWEARILEKLQGEQMRVEQLLNTVRSTANRLRRAAAADSGDGYELLVEVVAVASELEAGILSATAQENSDQPAAAQAEAREATLGSRHRGAEDEEARPLTDCYQLLRGHSDNVSCVAAAGLERLVSGSADKSVKVWDVKSGVCQWTLEDHRDSVTCVTALRPDVLASGSDDGTVKVWDATYGQLFVTLEGHAQSVRGVAAIAPDRLVSSSDDKTLKIWDVTTGQCLRTLQGHQDRVRSVTAFGSGCVASGSFDQSVKIWSAADGRCVATLKGHNNWVRAVVDLGRDRLASCADDKTIRIWDSSSRRCLRVLQGHKDFVTSLAVRGSGHLASGSDDHNICLWDINGSAVREGPARTLTGHENLVRGVAALGPYCLASASFDQTVRVWGNLEYVSCL